MNAVRRRRMFLVGAIALGGATAVTLALQAFNENLMFFFSPTEVVAGEAPEGRPFRIGGMVVEGSVERDPDTLDVQFALTDNQEQVTVVYRGILPDLFREGQGIVANGRLAGGGVFRAEEVLAKHDENYMPPEVAAAMKPPKSPTSESGGGSY